MFLALATTAGRLLQSQAAVGPAQELAHLVHRHGHELPLPAQSGWDAHPALALAVRSLYAYVPVPLSPPVLKGAQSLANNALVHCSRRTCTASDTALEAAQTTDDQIVKAALQQLVAYHGHTTDTDENDRILASTFAAFNVPSYACDVESDCGQFGDDFECCSRGDTVPGVCCSPFDLNQYDAPVPLAVIVVFLSCAGLLLLWIVFQDQFRSILSRVIGSASDFQTPQKRTRPTRWTSTP